MIWYRPDKTNITREAFDHALEDILSTSNWILDGNYSRTMEKRMQMCDTVFFLDLPTEVCLQGVRSRLGVKREDMPWVEEKIDDEFSEFIINFSNCERLLIYALVEKYPNKCIVIFRTRAEIDQYLKHM